jgi:transcription initiation factor TFIIE subunit alpha
VARYVREKMAAQRAMGLMDEDGLKIAQGGGRAQEVEIQLVDDEDDEEKRKERQKAAEEKRRQNALPTWHTTSTISGEKTALGVKADERSSNDAILAALDAQAKAAEAKAQSYDTFGASTYPDS